MRTIPLPPVTWPILCFLSGLTGLYLALEALSSAGKVMSHRGSLVWTIILICASVFLFSIVRTSYRVHTLNFSNLIGPLFVRREGKTNILSSYTATCPDCGGTVRLTFKRNSKGYRAECQNNPLQHVFSFDHTNLAGTHIVVR